MCPFICLGDGASSCTLHRSQPRYPAVYIRSFAVAKMESGTGFCGVLQEAWQFLSGVRTREGRGVEVGKWGQSQGFIGFSVMWGPTSRLFLDVERDQLLTVYKDAQTAH